MGKKKHGLVEVVGMKGCGHCRRESEEVKRLKAEGYNVKMTYLDDINPKNLSDSERKRYEKMNKSLSGVPGIFFNCDVEGKRDPIGKVEGFRKADDLKKLIHKVDGKCKKK